MNIIKENIDDLNATLKVNIEKTDYEDKVEKVLRDYRRKANIKGFRPGMVPFGLIKKIYGKAVQLDEINKIVSEGIQKYLTDEKIEILGDPLPEIDDDEVIDFDTQQNFNFSFELGLAPQFEIKLSKKNKVNYYEIIVDEKMKNDYVENYKRRFGQFTKPEKSVETDMLKGNIVALDDKKNVLPDGLSAENTVLSIDIIKDEKIKKHFIGKSVDDTIDFDLRKAFPSDIEIAGILNKQKDEVSQVMGKFRFTIKEINRFRPAEIGKELFDKVYGEGIINSEEDFMKRNEVDIIRNLKQESGYRLRYDIKKLTIDKTEFSCLKNSLKDGCLK